MGNPRNVLQLSLWDAFVFQIKNWAFVTSQSGNEVLKCMQNRILKLLFYWSRNDLLLPRQRKGPKLSGKQTIQLLFKNIIWTANGISTRFRNVRSMLMIVFWARVHAKIFQRIPLQHYSAFYLILVTTRLWQDFMCFYTNKVTPPISSIELEKNVVKTKSWSRHVCVFGNRWCIPNSAVTKN